MSKQGFDQVWLSATQFRKPSAQLRPLLWSVYDRIVEPSTDFADIRSTLEELLVYLSSSSGRTDANCCVTDRFFSLVAEWEKGWSHLPLPLSGVLDDMGGTLHETIYAPQIAGNFQSLPEQLLERVRAI